MSNPQEKAMKEAQSILKSAEKECKGGIFSKPDYASGGAAFEKAYNILYKAKLYKEAMNAAMKGADAYDKCNLPLKAGALSQNASQAAFQDKQYDQLVPILDLCKCRFQAGNQALAGIRAVREMASRMRPIDKEISYQLYNSALDLVEDDEQYTWEKETFLDCACLALEMKKYPDVFKAWARAEKAFLFLKNTDAAAHCISAIIAIHLQRGDIVAAQNVFEEAMQKEYYVHTEDFSMIDFILRGVKNQDGDLIEAGQKNFIIQMLKPEIGRIIMGFKAPKSAPQLLPGSGEAAPAPAPAQDDKDEEESDLDLL
ncbi:hypothetical protein TVAG_432640 [Trichomonas vaginalis G3]|uniref:Gamma-soluble NSF attachment protein n=1 Tax=Trichomonas vaginalis (strain ATCC PRA-98 / G3) TaxID=412133 RepID=A2DIQ5_TRIV3|nr:tetratricopeptide repeat domain domain-containing protein [Trichomonas vaginalis G3]EAY19668.1 hypothetical protein TVAG_432640 [Trichomonas vaginalis G3]KAI5521312.1 tetratricopeptide repeat domain domain-containing protein [Trichomonas vaginalis G3]|eukprot:XP_001580654.1 hypothetical protein [Trichomonas vaginalis G3]